MILLVVKKRRNSHSIATIFNKKQDYFGQRKMIGT